MCVEINEGSHRRGIKQLLKLQLDVQERVFPYDLILMHTGVLVFTIR